MQVYKLNLERNWNCIRQYCAHHKTKRKLYCQNIYPQLDKTTLCSVASATVFYFFFAFFLPLYGSWPRAFGALPPPVVREDEHHSNFNILHISSWYNLYFIHFSSVLTCFLYTVRFSAFLSIQFYYFYNLLPIYSILLICDVVNIQQEVQDKTFIDVQFITVQREMSITKVKRNVSSLWLSSILWHSLLRAQIIIRYVLTLFIFTLSLIYMITLLWLLSDCFTSDWLRAIVETRSILQQHEALDAN